MHTAIVFAMVQLLLAATWTVYAAFLPQLAAQAGIPKEHVAWILLMDQTIFMVTDVALGVAADRVARAMRRMAWGSAALLLAAFVTHNRSHFAGQLHATRQAADFGKN